MPACCTTAAFTQILSKLLREAGVSFTTIIEEPYPAHVLRWDAKG